MRLGLLASTICATIALADPDLRYTIERRDNGSQVAIASAFTGDADGVTEVTVESEWGGNKADTRDFVEVAATGSDGRPLKVTKSADFAWDIAHNPREPVTLAYTLREPSREPLAPGHNDYRTRIRPDLFQMIGNHGILYPRHYADGAPHEHAVEWRGFDLPGARAVSSLGPDAIETASITADRFRQSLFIAGKLAYIDRDVGGGRVGLVISGMDEGAWNFTPEQLGNLAFKIIAAQREFFDDHSDPWYLISLTPEGRVRNGSFSLGGTALTNCFALYCNAGISLAEGSPYLQQIYHVLAHEYFHTWNGLKFHIEGPEGSNYWFSEGFTEFFTRRMLRRADLWNNDAVLADINRSIAEHDGNPRRSAPNSQIQAEFWTDQDISRLPYRRGDLLAIALDEEIRRTSHNTRSLDDVFRELVHETRERGSMPDVGHVLARFERETSPEFIARWKRTIDDGADPQLPAALMELDATLTVGKSRGFDPGFDMQASQREKKLVGVKPDSAAARAGLAEGMLFRTMNIGGGSPDAAPKGEIEVQVNGRWTKITYDAVGPERDTRAYRRRP